MGLFASFRAQRRKGFVTICMLRNLVTLHQHCGSRNSVARIATRLRAGGPLFESLEGQGIFRFSKASRPDLGHTSVRNQWVLVSFSAGYNGWGCDVDRSPPSNAEVKNEWRFTSIPLICLHCVDRYLTLPRILTLVVQGDE